ncbi:MAG: DEAD/DEAH box helicase family protein [Nitrospirales bacterium]|nr:DEAD/DEAH box helicase family protein [Nitrospirales bacterium]
MPVALELYVYTTHSYRMKGYVKVGHCIRGRHRERIREQFGTSNPEPPIICLTEDLPNGKTDHHIHQQLINNGVQKVEDSVGQEWFMASLEDVKRAFHEVCFGSSRIESYRLRQEQQMAVNKALKWFRGGYPHEVMEGAAHQERFLLNAKMRFGKCFTGVHIAKAMGAQKSLIVTYKPEVISEWLNVINNHIDFETWTGIRARKNAENSNEPYLPDSGELPQTTHPIVVCVSLQDLDINADGSTKKRLKEIVTANWDMIIFDEVHFGSRTERAKYIIENQETGIGLKWGKRLDLSGTPFRLIQEDDFCPEQVFTYSYLDEQENKKHEIQADPHNMLSPIYRVMPDLDVSTIEITDEDIQTQRETFFTDDLDFSLNELFRVSSSKFVHSDAVDHFIDGLCRQTHDARSISIFGKLADQLGLPTKRHSVWWLSRVDSAKTLAKKLKRHPYFSNFEIINAAGGANSDDQDHAAVIVRDKNIVERTIKSTQSNSAKYGTITLTVRRFLTGVTIKEWDSILVLNDVGSAETYFQAIFRVQSSWYDHDTRQIMKPKAWVFDFAITRCLRLTFHYADALADQLDQQNSTDQVRNDNIQHVTDGLCETLNIKRFYEGRLLSDKTTANDVFEAINFTGSRLSLAKRITSNALISFISLKHLEQHPNLLDALKRVKGYRTQEVGGIEEFVKIGRDAEELKKNNKTEPQDEEELEDRNNDFIESEQDKEKKSRKRWFATQVKRLAICMADFVYMTRFREHKIDHVIETKDSEFFRIVTGITKDEFRELCELEFINRHALNRIVREFRCQEESSIKPEEYINRYLEKTAGDPVLSAH